MPIINYVGQMAKDAVLEFNLRQLSKMAEMRFIEEGKYPGSIGELVEGQGLGNFTSSITYQYRVSADGQQAKILGAFSDQSFCWSSTTEQIRMINSSADCQ